MSEAELPPGWSIELDTGARRTDDGRVLIGGSPLRLLRLTPAGARWLDDVAAGRPLPCSAPSRRLARRLVDAGLARPRPPARAGASPGTPTDTVTVALVVPVRDDHGGLARTLRTGTASGTGGGSSGGTGRFTEIVVVDDASADAGVLAAAAADGMATADAVTMLLRNEQRLGPAGARERGWRATTAPVVVFVDADVDADVEGDDAAGWTTGGDWLAPLLAHFDDPAVGAVAPRVGCAPKGAPPWLAAYEAVRSPLDMGPRAGAVRPGGPVPYVPTTVLVVRRVALEAVGGFDTTLHVGEDVDLVWRLLAAGWRVHYEPSVLVRHPIRPGTGAWARQRVRYGTSAAPLAARHGDAPSPLRISGWSAAAWAAVLARRPLLGLGIATGTTLALVPKLRSLRHPLAEALRIAGLGNLAAGVAMADALWRPWWPAAAVVALGWRRSRPALVAAAVVPPVLEWRRRRPRLDPLRYLVLRRADDLAYGAGVWLGCLRARSARALLPSFTGPIPPPEAAASS